MLTTVLSMNAMLEPRMVAASTHDCDLAGQGTPPQLPLRITASSQGCFMTILDALRLDSDSVVNEKEAIDDTRHLREDPHPGSRSASGSMLVSAYLIGGPRF